jgi:nucleotide-binding universal stress UspA family protein
MNGMKKLLVATGCSDYSRGLFRYSINLARSMEAEIIVASIINSRDVDAVSRISSLGYEVDGEHYVEGVRQEREKYISRLLQEENAIPDKVRMVILVGNPIDELLTLSVKEKVDMIVMGIKGRTDLAKFFVGSVAEKVFRRSPVPVLSFRDEKSEARLRKRIPSH